jgi:cyclase
MPDYFNEHWQNHFRRKLRNNPTRAEEVLWSRLSNNQLGIKFRRQHGFGQFIVDFYCWKANLVIEVDGGIHLRDDVRERDRIKERELNEHGLEVLRFTNEQVLGNIEKVLAVIRHRVTPFKGTKGSSSRAREPIRI